MKKWKHCSNAKGNSLINITKFSTSDNAILAFWLVHCVSVNSHYTYVNPYMEINAANVTRYNFFCEKPSFVGKKLNEKKKKNSVSSLRKKCKKLRTMLFQ